MGIRRVYDHLEGVTYNGFSTPSGEQPAADGPVRPPVRTYRRAEFRRHGARALASGWRAPAVVGLAVVCLAVAALGVGVFVGTAGWRSGLQPLDRALGAAQLTRSTEHPSVLPTSGANDASPAPPDPPAQALEAPRGGLHRASLNAAAMRPAFHCDWRLRPSERMVCGDPELAVLDRRLNHAFGQAVRAGAPRASLRAEQDRWELRREAAARRGPAAVEALYRARIAQLTALAHER